MSFPDKINFEIAFPDIHDSVLDIWLTLVSYLKQIELLPSKFDFSQITGHPTALMKRDLLSLTSEEITKLIRDRSMNGFLVYAGTGNRCVDYVLRTTKNSGNEATFRAQPDKLAKTPATWIGLIENTMTLLPSIGAWQWNMLYVAWQTKSRLHPGQETRYGQIPPGTRRWTEKSVDNIGPDTDFIDISLNPGRVKHLTSAVSFYPTAEMWLGPHFWQYAKCSKKEVLDSGIFFEKRDTPLFLYLKCWPTAFTRPDGEQGRMQQRLWKLFFHEDCEWPPGSGTICDMPMYGPPEFLPT